MTDIPPIEKLDFSEFHPLDHRPFDARCRSLPGGGRRHLELWWVYKADVPSKIKRVTHCSRGKHHFAGGETIMFLGRPVTVQRACQWCWAHDPDWPPGE
jgi:hypothetical protein